MWGKQAAQENGGLASLEAFKSHIDVVLRDWVSGDLAVQDEWLELKISKVCSKQNYSVIM